MDQKKINIVAANDRDEFQRFLQLPWKIYKDDPNWVPPLLLAVQQTLDIKKNPFFKHARMKMWNAYQGGEHRGRIVGIIDENHNRFHDEKTAFWGFFECVNDKAVAQALFSTVENWSRHEGMLTLRGPMNPSTNHECGMQISAFETKPFIMMTQNPEYYPRLVEDLGYAKAKDLYAWLLDNSQAFDSRLIKHAERIASTQGIHIRHTDMSRFDEEVEVILSIYNDAWEKNWGFVPMTDEEFRHMAKDLKAILIPELMYIAEVAGEPAAFGIFLPDLNMVMEKIPTGKLFPTGLLKLLWYTKVKKSYVNRGRILTLGVKKKFRHLGLAPALYMRYFVEAPKLGYPQAECSWILEDNVPMNTGLQQMKATHYKTYRIYDKLL